MADQGQDKPNREDGAANAVALEGGGGEGGQTRREFVTTVGVGLASAAIIGEAGCAPRSADESLAQAANTTPVYRIHPAIGVARLGNVDPGTGFIIGPEIPGQRATDGLSGAQVAQYKVDGQIKPQAARFRVYEYRADANGRLNPVGEVSAQTPTPGQPFVKAVTWKVHLANRKAAHYEVDGPVGETMPAGPLRNPTVADRASLENDFGPRTISGSLASPQVFSPATAGAYPARVARNAGGSVVIDYLGQLRTDGSGRLLVFGGKGRSVSSISPPQPLSHWANNNYWFDDIADGPVTATVTIDDGFGRLTEVPTDAAGNAWVLVAPPDFSPGLQASVTVYDLLQDMAVRSLPIPTNNGLYYNGGPLERTRLLNEAWAAAHRSYKPGDYEFGALKPDYQSEIWPMVLNAANLLYQTGLVNVKHSYMLSEPLGDPGPGAARDRDRFFSYLRPPENAATNSNGPATMPRMYGDNWYIGESNFSYSFVSNGPGNGGGGGLGDGRRSVPRYQRYMTLTPTQYGLLRAWKDGNFIPPPGTVQTPSSVTPHGLDRAALENGVGGPFYPGIECSWQLRNPKLFIEPFRLNHAAVSQFLLPSGAKEGTTIRAGHFSRQMALPWQADFLDCSKLLHLAWWPTARPDDVLLDPGNRLADRVPWMRTDTQFPSGGTSPIYEDMVSEWYKLGFIREAGGGVYIEDERNSHVP